MVDVPLNVTKTLCPVVNQQFVSFVTLCELVGKTPSNENCSAA